jgi:HK97 family phage major capsid protein
MVDINRSDVSTLIEDAYSQVLLEAASAGSQALQAFPTVNLGTKTTNMPMLAALPQAGWVTEDIGDASSTKPTSEVRWKNTTMVVEEIAVIVPVHEDVLADATTDVLTQVSQLAGQAIGQKLDQAVIWGIGKPASWTSSALYTAASTASQTAAYTSGAASADDIVGKVNQSAKTLAGLGLLPDTLLANLTFRYDIVNLRDANGLPIFRDEQFAGFNTSFSRNGTWDNSRAKCLVVDSSRVRIGVRQDITVKFLDQATVGGINLAEKDMVALRFKARYGYVLSSGATAFSSAPVPVAAVINAGS